MAVHISFLDHKVTQSTPSPALCLVETQDAQNSHIAAFYSGDDGSTNSDNESSSSNTVRDVHIVRTTIANLNLTMLIKIVCVQYNNL